MIILGGIASILGAFKYHKQKTKEKINGVGVTSKTSALGAAYLMSFGGILIMLGVMFLLEVLK
jgi:hypothetical protein